MLVLLAHVVAHELVRLPLDGPAVDGIRLDSTYGIIAFMTGRFAAVMRTVLAETTR